MTHAELVVRAERWLRTTMRCAVVLTERALRVGGEQPDAIGWTAYDCIVVECKASRSDFLADRAKPHCRNPELAMGQRRFYMVPEGLLTVADVAGTGAGLAQVLEATARVRVLWKGSPVAGNPHRERRLLVSELSRYQIHGITYPPLVPLAASLPVLAAPPEGEQPT